MMGALALSGCGIIRSSSPDRAPFVLVFETPAGERMGIVAYAFLATRTPTRNRPPDERSFQVKYGSKSSYADDNVHELWQDPLGMFTTMLIGIDPERAFCVAADPVLHSPTKFFIRLEFKDEHADQILSLGWHAWERAKTRTPPSAPRVETLVGATQPRFLDLVRFERAARELDPGNRLILAESHTLSYPIPAVEPVVGSLAEGPSSAELLIKARGHPIAQEFKLSPDQILDLIGSARRLKVAARGWVAEEHLRATLARFPGVTHCERLDEEGGPDLSVSFRGAPPVTIECKNVARQPDRLGNPRIDFQRTRAAKGNACSRYYRPSDFDIVAACLHAVTAEWTFSYVLPTSLASHKKCDGRLASNVRVDTSWETDVERILRSAYAARGVEL